MAYSPNLLVPVPFLIRQLHYLVRLDFLNEGHGSQSGLASQSALDRLPSVRTTCWKVMLDAETPYFNSAPSCNFNSIMTRCCGSRKPPHTCCRGGPAVFFFFCPSPLDNPRDRRCKASWHKRNSPCPLRQRISFQGKLRLHRQGIFFEVGEEKNQSNRVEDEITLWGHCGVIKSYIISLWSYDYDVA